MRQYFDAKRQYRHALLFSTRELGRTMIPTRVEPDVRQQLARATHPLLARQSCFGHRQLDVPYHALATVALPTYQPGECPLCAAGGTAVKPGSRT